MKHATLSPTVLKHPLIEALDASALKNLVARIQYSMNTGTTMRELCESDQVREALNQIELDLWVNAGAPDGIGKDVSSWIVHVSWALSVDERPSEIIDSEALMAANQVKAGDVRSLLPWLNAIGSAIEATASRVLQSKSFDAFVVNLMVLDMLVLNSLAAIARFRLVTLPA
jgi:hypothetical protein